MKFWGRPGCRIALALCALLSMMLWKGILVWKSFIAACILCWGMSWGMCVWAAGGLGPYGGAAPAAVPKLVCVTEVLFPGVSRQEAGAGACALKQLQAVWGVVPVSNSSFVWSLVGDGVRRAQRVMCSQLCGLTRSVSIPHSLLGEELNTCPDLRLPECQL